MTTVVNKSALPSGDLPKVAPHIWVELVNGTQGYLYFELVYKYLPRHSACE